MFLIHFVLQAQNARGKDYVRVIVKYKNGNAQVIVNAENILI